MRTTTLRRTLAAIAIAAAAALAIAGAAAPHAKADGLNGPTSLGCTAQTDLWGFLGSQRRTLCDWPARPDGSWTRERLVWIPEHDVPFTCDTYGGRYSSHTTCGGGYHVDVTQVSDEAYPVTPDTVLPDEPGHLDGTVAR